MMDMTMLGAIADVEALTQTAGTIWSAVLAIGIAIVGYRVGKRLIGKF